MDERQNVRSGRVGRALAAELLLAGLILGYGFPLPRVVPLLLLASMSLWTRGLGWVELGLRRPSMTVTLVGGVIGLVIAMGGAAAISAISPIPAAIPLWAVVASLVAAAVWWRTVLQALLAALVILVAVRLVIAPFAVWVTGAPIDQSAFEPLRGNARLLLVSLLLAWTLAAFGEEMVFRGYVMRRLADLIGDTRTGWTVALVVSSAFFGWAHRYQGPAGMVATGLIGALLALLYLRTGRNLWTVILCHAAVDTVALTVAYLDRASLLFP